MATAKKSSPPPFTTILLVRHGQTPTTGKVLPGRARGLHLADEGHRQACLLYTSDAADDLQPV